jgi:hypothetical protein
MIQLDNLTIVGIAGTKGIETMQAIKYSMRGNLKFGHAILLTPEKIESDSQVTVIPIDEMNYEQYNHFIVYKLHEYIDTDYCLLVQNDGYVINPDAWQFNFYNYDYIGAIWPDPQDSFSFRDHEGTLYRTGNGGFSLRSKKLLSLATELHLPWKPYHGFYHEDGFYCVHNRKIYEANGCKFADVDVAKYFSHEAEVEENKGIIPFGFHGRNTYYYNITKKSLTKY